MVKDKSEIECKRDNSHLKNPYFIFSKVCTNDQVLSLLVFYLKWEEDWRKTEAHMCPVLPKDLYCTWSMISQNGRLHKKYKKRKIICGILDVFDLKRGQYQKRKTIAMSNSCHRPELVTDPRIWNYFAGILRMFWETLSSLSWCSQGTSWILASCRYFHLQPASNWQALSYC